MKVPKNQVRDCLLFVDYTLTRNGNKFSNVETKFHSVCSTLNETTKEAFIAEATDALNRKGDYVYAAERMHRILDVIIQFIPEIFPSFLNFSSVFDPKRIQSSCSLIFILRVVSAAVGTSSLVCTRSLERLCIIKRTISARFQSMVLK